MSTAEHAASTDPGGRTQDSATARGRGPGPGAGGNAVPRQRKEKQPGGHADHEAGMGIGMGEDSDTEDDSAVEDMPQQEPDPLYDEAADDKDEAWAEEQRSGRVSDAMLSCPGCFTTLCIDCQRHEKYHQQYRAMFVMNCQVDDEADDGVGGDFDPTSSSGAGAGAGAAGGGRGGRRPKRAKPSARYRRVRCGVCGTEVGAYEVEEELYHFYHVFPSNA